MHVRRLLAVAGLAVAAVVVTPAIASAHPLGNFTVNRYDGIRVGSDRIEDDYVVDMAEIPTFQTKPRIDRNGDGRVSASESDAYVRTTCASLARGVHVTLDHRMLAMHVAGGALRFPPGQAGLDTLRLECRLRTDTGSHVTSSDRHLTVVDTNLTDRIGWREMTAVGDGATLVHSPLPTDSISDRLTAYPKNRLRSAPDVRRAELRFRPGGAAAPALPVGLKSPTASVARGFDHWTRSFTASVAARRLTLGLALVALAFSIGLGALHAFAPGHGKTVMAAYLVGERGTVRDGLLIGVTVAATHTVGVLVLGLVLTASQTFAPESLYPWLALASGVTFVALGLSLLVGALRRRRGVAGLLHGHHHHGEVPGHEHAHPHPHADPHADPHASAAHAHSDAPELVLAHAGPAPGAHAHALADHTDAQAHGHDHGHHHHTDAHAHAEHDHKDAQARPEHDHAENHHDRAPVHHHDHAVAVHEHDDGPALSRRRLLTLGFAGGLVPTPTAIVVLLGATAIGRAWFGVVLVLAYGVGMAATLVGAGLLLARARRRFELKAHGDRLLRYATVIPVATAVVVTASGLWLVAKAAISV